MCIIHVFRRSHRGVILGLLAAALVKGSAGAQTSVKFALDWKFEGPAAPFLVAVDRGYFTAERLDVTIEPGNGSLEPINRVASGAYDIGFGDINTLIKFRDRNRGAQLKAVFMVYNKPPGAIVARKSRGVTMPKDLEGKKLGAPARDAAFALWPIFVQTTGIDARKVTVLEVGFAAREPILADHGIRFDQSGAHLRQRGGWACDHHVDLSGHQILHRRAAATIRHELKAGVCHVLE